MTSKTILVAEDDQDINDLLCEHLSSQGYTTISVFNGDEALSQAKQNQIDLFILDWMMPGLTGIELCKFIRNEPKLTNTPIIMLTARSDADSIIGGLDSGANDYITKPFDLRELSARVRAQLRSSPSSNKEGQKLTFKELSINTNSYQVLIQDKEIKLTKSEFLLLKALLEKPNTVYSRRDLVKLIQGDQTFVTDRTIDTHMTGLRKKIAPYSNQIKTVRGIGYKFEV